MCQQKHTHQFSTRVTGRSPGTTLFVGGVLGRVYENKPPVAALDFDMYTAIPTMTARATQPATAPPMTTALIPDEDEEEEEASSFMHVTELEGAVVSICVYGCTVRSSRLKFPPPGECG